MTARCLQVCEFLRRYDLVPARPYGHHSSEQAWRARANKRRDGAAPAQLFIADLVQRLRHVVCSHLQSALARATVVYGRVEDQAHTSRSDDTDMLRLSIDPPRHSSDPAL